MSSGLQLKQAILATHRLVRLCGVLRESCHLCPSRLPVSARARGFGTNPAGSGGEDGGSSSQNSVPNIPSVPFKRPLFGRRRHLSPLERISRLVPEENLTSEVLQLREDTKDEDGAGSENTQTGKGPSQSLPGQTSNHEQVVVGECKEDSQSQTKVQELDSVLVGNSVDTVASADIGHALENLEESCTDSSVTDHLPGERPLSYGELVLADRKRKKRTEFRKMFLLEEGAKLHSTWGWVAHDDIAKQPSGSILHTSLGTSLLLRRPSLDEYTLYMRRGPAISYPKVSPKDCTAMLQMMDVTEGDCVLESGSGSGSMTLFLSRAVGSKGRVLSVEVRDDHHRRASLNYKRWRTSWAQRRGEDWPDNVHFVKADLQTAGPLLNGWGFHSIALDMVDPHLVLPTVVPHLHPGAVCAVYLANITQVVDLLDGIRCSKVPLMCERIAEVQYRDWLVAPSIRKDGSLNNRKAPKGEIHEEDDDEEEDDNSNGEDKEARSPGNGRPFGSVPYVARPHPEQTSHTAFLVKLRKVLK
ncbi:tRNA (adenine(58)-N(1))-methyltransferase, mitochondrial isoform X2 [Engraulis encrasicolus]|uniref:tRNA (adenine(58)-N(1))-methyltransferase, mitochondrial isoform X2 n=1 Tax=Engraulis encrasicolus TaxID=184585 RepID=UPI002FD464C7